MNVRDQVISMHGRVSAALRSVWVGRRMGEGEWGVRKGTTWEGMEGTEDDQPRRGEEEKRCG